MDEDTRYLCTQCYVEQVAPARAQRCINDKEPITCPQCGDKVARQVKHCVVNMNKVAYMVVTDREILKQLNPKRTT
jgi:hypothetical protein